ncbi:uncharacterized protein LOC113760525 isoform X2 [Coffea eugenioides]|uniref:Uncharacterized protein isoform X2 n=1 Tax=Coffea arabica TaxID=13443 RepID=A0A6P6W8V3_COFAR|nr:uncharacterized protein LOC113731007 isoform X2 [Coffea arabica]XP_027158946.1 uncharacterized protein LOC113760525 isoform X2 [Coffea eugenioides]
MAEIEVPWDDAGRGGIAVVGDLKESSSPVHKKQRSDEKDELEFYDEDIRQINLQADQLVYTEKDHALDSIISILNDYYPDGCNDENDVWFKYWRQLVDSEVPGALILTLSRTMILRSCLSRTMILGTWPSFHYWSWKIIQAFMSVLLNRQTLQLSITTKRKTQTMSLRRLRRQTHDFGVQLVPIFILPSWPRILMLLVV